MKDDHRATVTGPDGAQLAAAVRDSWPRARRWAERVAGKHDGATFELVAIGGALHRRDGTHRTTPPTASGRELERHEAALLAHLAEAHATARGAEHLARLMRPETPCRRCPAPAVIEDAEDGYLCRDHTR